MRLKNKIIISFVFSIICIIFFKTDSLQALTQEEAGKYIAEFAINFFDNYADQTIYSSKNDQRSQAFKGEKTSGITSHGATYSDKYAMDCVAWVSFVINQSMKLKGGAAYGGFTIYAQPGHNGQTASYFNGFSEVYGNMNSGKKLSLDELRKVLKPGDLLLATRQHILIYVGNDEIIHCTGHGPGPSYGGDKNYGIRREKLSDYSAGFESVGRITIDAAGSVNKSDATTIFKGSGGITNKWSDSDSSSSSSSEAYQNGRIVDTNDKLPLFKHILLTEKI